METSFIDVCGTHCKIKFYVTLCYFIILANAVWLNATNCCKGAVHVALLHQEGGTTGIIYFVAKLVGL